MKQSPEQNLEFDRAFEQLKDLVDLRQADLLHPRRPNAIYTACVVLWMLIFQRLKPDASLEAAVKHLIENQPGYLPENKRLSQGTLSSNSAAYSRARSELPLDVVKWFSNEITRAIVGQSEPLLDGRQIFLLDGTTITLAPEKELQTKYPPASNQHGESVWPVVNLTVFHELSSGCALLPQLGAMYGPEAVSETELARNGMHCLPDESIIMADAGFGIFGVAHQAQLLGHDFFLRMKKLNFESLRAKAKLVSQSPKHKTYQHQWTPTPKNRKTQPGLPRDASLAVVLHEINVNETLTLYCVTSLPQDAATLGNLYNQRVNVEVDIRNLKVVLDTENIRAKKVDTFLKELYTSVVAYNLVGQFRRQAAELNQVAPRRMSFKRTWTTFQTFLLKHLHTEPELWRKSFERALFYATKDKLPNRAANRSVKRECYAKHSKRDHFEKRKKPPEKLKHTDLK